MRASCRTRFADDGDMLSCTRLAQSQEGTPTETGYDADIAAMARRGYEKWLRETRMRADAVTIKRYAHEVTKDDRQRFFGFDQTGLIKVLTEAYDRKRGHNS